MQRLEVSGVVRPLYGSLGVKGLRDIVNMCTQKWTHRVPSRKNVDSIPDGGHWNIFVGQNAPGASVKRNEPMEYSGTFPAGTSGNIKAPTDFTPTFTRVAQLV